MFKTILVPTDGSPFADKAMNAAMEYAKAFDSKIIGLCVAEPYPYSALVADGLIDDPERYEEKLRNLAHEHLQKLKAAASAMKVPCETYVTTSQYPYEEILKAATAYRCDAIFMASHGRKGLDKLLLGSETQKVLSHASIPVLVMR